MVDAIVRRPLTLALVTCAALATLLFLVAALYPGGILIRTSLTAASGDFSGEAWNRLIAFRYLLATPLLHSVVLGFATALAASTLAVPLAWLATRSNLPGAGAILPFVVLPHIIPGFQLASSWVLLFTQGGIWSALVSDRAPLPAYGGTAIWLVLTLHLYVFPFAAASASMAGLDLSVEEAGRSAGLSAWRVLRRITLPLTMPAILSGGLLCFAYAIEEFGVPSLLGAPMGFSTLTTAVYEQATTPPLSFGTASAQSIVLGLLVVLVLIIGFKLAGRRQTAMLAGKGRRSGRNALGRWRWPLATLVWLFLAGTSLMPLAALTLTSFLKFWGQGYGPDNWTLARHAALIATPEFANAALNTLVVAGIAAVLATLTGVVVAYGALCSRARWAVFTDHVSFAAFAMPGLVIGVALMLAFSGGVINLYGTYAILVIAYMLRFSGIAVRSTAASLQQVGSDIAEAARVAGLSRVRVVLRIFLPLARQGIGAGFLLAFINGVKEISSTSLLVSQGHETMAYEAYIRFQEGNYTQGSALSLWMIALVLVVVALVARWGGKAGRETVP